LQNKEAEIKDQHLVCMFSVAFSLPALAADSRSCAAKSVQLKLSERDANCDPA